MRVSLGELPGFCERLQRAGYTLHRGARTTRSGEIEAWRRMFAPDRQVHVQLVQASRGSDVLVFAHTEPAGFTLRHLVAALFDQVSYQAGARVLRSDLEAKGTHR